MIIKTVRALKDNYCYLITEEGSKTAAVVDPSEAAPIMTALRDLGLKLGLILNTHHHPDHVGGNLELVEHWQCPVFCSARDFDRVPGATRALNDGDEFAFEELDFSVLAIPGHTEGQIAYHVEDALFVGDTVFEMGCGRLFEGTAEQMFASFARIKALPPETRLFFGHEYAELNARFSRGSEPGNVFAIDERLSEVRAQIKKTGFAAAPTLAVELKVNPFMRAKTVEDFARLREARNTFVAPVPSAAPGGKKH